jgi:hypothetical protein
MSGVKHRLRGENLFPPRRGFLRGRDESPYSCLKRSYVSSERELILLLMAAVDLLAKLSRAHLPQMSRRYVRSRCPGRRTSPSERIPRPDHTCCLWQHNGRSGQARLPFSWERDKTFSCKSMFQRALQKYSRRRKPLIAVHREAHGLGLLLSRPLSVWSPPETSRVVAFRSLLKRLRSRKTEIADKEGS